MIRSNIHESVFFLSLRIRTLLSCLYAQLIRSEVESQAGTCRTNSVGKVCVFLGSWLILLLYLGLGLVSRCECSGPTSLTSPT